MACSWGQKLVRQRPDRLRFGSWRSQNQRISLKMGLTLPEGAEGFHGEGWMGRMGGFAGEDGHPMDMFNAAAEVLGMTPEELFAELQAGKTPQEILDENDVDLATLRESLQELMPEGVGHFRGGGRRMGRMGGFGKLGGGPMGGTDAVAEALGMTPEELSAELQAGKTLEEIIEAQGHDPEEFLSDVAEESIAQAVEATSGRGS